MDKNKISLLLVEDEAINAMMEKMGLEKYGYSVHHVTTGEKAVSIIIEETFPINLILMDINLGSGIDGTQAAEQILNHKNIPVVFLSSHTEPDVVEKTEMITSYGYVVKNSGFVVLDASIKMALKLFEANNKLSNELTERKQAEEALRVSEERYRMLFNRLLYGCEVINPAGIITECNPGTARMLSYSKEEIIGQPITKFLDAPSQQIFKEKFPRLLKGESLQAEIKMLRKDGKLLNILRATSPIFDEKDNVAAVLALSVDITERKLAEEALEKNEHFLQTIFDGIQEPMHVIDRDYKVLLTNKKLLELKNVTQEDIRGKYCYEAYQGRNELCGQCGAKEVFQTGKSVSLIKSLPLLDGTYRYFEVYSFPLLEENGEVKQVIEMTKDITERKQAEEAIKKQLEEKEILLREVHHRIKNNMANVESLLSLQAGSIDNPETKAALQESLTRVQSIRILYDKLLLTKDYQDISIKSYVEGLLDAISSVYVTKNKITIQKQITDFTINSNKAIYLGIIINELLTNVFKYAFESYENGNVSISIEKAENIATLIIQDNGVGIDAGINLNKSPGLGFTLVKILVEQLGGTYSSVNENGTKSTVQFEI